MIYIKLKAYLVTLASQENRKPKEKRRPVPSIPQLANDVGIPRVTMSRIAHGHIKRLSLDKGDRIIEAMRARGFDMKMTDLIDYKPNAELASSGLHAAE